MEGREGNEFLRRKAEARGGLEGKQVRQIELYYTITNLGMLVRTGVDSITISMDYGVQRGKEKKAGWLQCSGINWKLNGN